MMLPRRLAQRAAGAICMALLFSSTASAQQSAGPQPSPESRRWITVGGGLTALKGDCSNCSGDPVYRKAGSLMVDFGFRGNRRLDGSVELLWVPAKTSGGERIRSTLVMGTAQYRPSEAHGFFLKGGMGIGFIRNWIYDATNDATPPFTTNAMALVYGAGWEFRTGRRVGLQIFGLHHIVALGDLNRSDGTSAQDVLGNFWTAGASIVIR